MLSINCPIPKCKNGLYKEFDFCKKHSQKYKFQKEDCPICLENVQNEAYPLLDCGHWVHFDCIVNSNKLECPLCRQKISPKNLTTEQLQKFNQKEEKRKEEEEEKEIIRLIRQEDNLIFLERMKYKYNGGVINDIFCDDERLLFDYLESSTRLAIYRDLIKLRQSPDQLVNNTAKMLKQYSKNLHNNLILSNVDLGIKRFILRQVSDLEYQVYHFCKRNLNRQYY